MSAGRTKRVVQVDAELLRMAEAVAAVSGWQIDEVVEEALRRYLEERSVESNRLALRQLLDRIGGAGLDDNEALDLAYTELHAARRARRRS
jgi:hypothetical protein